MMIIRNFFRERIATPVCALVRNDRFFDTLDREGLPLPVFCFYAIVPEGSENPFNGRKEIYIFWNIFWKNAFSAGYYYCNEMKEEGI